MLLHSSRSHDNINAHSSTRTERTEKDSIHIEMETSIALICDSRHTKDWNFGRPSKTQLHTTLKLMI